MIVALVGARVITGNGEAALTDGTVVSEDGRILEVSRNREFGSDVWTLDAKGKTIMPGLIDCHQHFAPWFQWLISEQKHSLMYLAAKTVCLLRATLESGCTAARDLAGLEAGMCSAGDECLIAAPRVRTSLVIIQPTNGLLDHAPGLPSAITPQGLTIFPPGLPMPWCDGPVAARAKVREVLRYGADFIKIANDGAPLPKLRPDRPLFTSEELEAIVDEAHRAGVPVACHANYSESALAAVRAGVDSIEHGAMLRDPVCLDEMARRGTWLVTSLSNANWHATSNPDPQIREWARGVVKQYGQGLLQARDAGVRLAMGTDAPFAAGETAVELKLLVEAGMSPMQTIQVSTQRAAECMRLGREIGTLEVGKYADLLVIDGDPLEDIGVLTQLDRLALVMKGGVPYSGILVGAMPPRPAPWPKPLF